ncbi:hypothetical protein [Niabella drilacis]|uniref:Coenzyme PQQ synthesis protein D (PqqD) n=1 Tax=Niabella drilacis (strain DSM 25811 / CCM 8410 / CCUG 62505 / LMG 26954 / E90) TaxID=1285928 RepID=A0A1G6JSX9_NIADE|nr:hypothetical protein [Niabella drilacis]SDC21803.1 hypothetical protein SAMN04487894_101629 [Niabella drilacis]
MFILNPRLAADIFEGEYIIANLDTGLYYSVQGLAVSLLNALPFEDEADLVRSFCESLPQHAAVIEAELIPVFRQLLDEDIVRSVEGAGITARARPDAPVAYQPPKFNKYADMQDLLMLDPIHDVDEEGWVVQKES